MPVLDDLGELQQVSQTGDVKEGQNGHRFKKNQHPGRGVEKANENGRVDSKSAARFEVNTVGTEKLCKI